MKLSFWLAVFAIIIWSSNAITSDFVLAKWTPFQLLTVEFIAATFTVLLLCKQTFFQNGIRSTSDFKVELADLRIGLIGITATIICQTIGFYNSPIIVANIISYAWPLLTTLWFVYCSKFSNLRSLTIALIGFVGVIIMIAGSDASSTSSVSQVAWITPKTILGYGAALISSVSMAYFSIACSNRSIPLQILLLPATITGAIICFGISIMQSGFRLDLGWPLLVSIYVGIAMISGYFLWSRAMHLSKNDNLAALGYSTPLLSTILLLISGHSVGSITTLIGITLVLGCNLGVMISMRQ